MTLWPRSAGRTRSPVRFVPLACALVGVASCVAPPEDGAVQVVVTDSAGVEVVTNLRAPAFPPVRDLPPAPEREVVHDALYQVTALHAFDDGGVAVGASGSSAILRPPPLGIPAPAPV